MDKIYLLDYGAGNVRSLINAVEFLGFKVKKIENKGDFESAQVCILD
jgi:glutamine amidotransferase/cyclase